MLHTGPTSSVSPVTPPSVLSEAEAVALLHPAQRFKSMRFSNAKSFQEKTLSPSVSGFTRNIGTRNNILQLVLVLALLL
jgi:hypothetical protein